MPAAQPNSVHVYLFVRNFVFVPLFKLNTHILYTCSKTNGILVYNAVS